MNVVDSLPSASEIEPEITATDEVFAQAEQAKREVDRRGRAYWIVGGVGVGILVLLIAVGIFVERTSFYAPVTALNERLAAEGLPTTWEGAQAIAPRPASELDATPEWQAFLTKHERAGEYDPLDVKTSEENVAVWIDDLQKLAASGRYRVATYPMSALLEDDYRVVLNEMSAESDLARILVARAKRQHGEGDADGAAESLALTLSLASNAKYEPFLICRLWGATQLDNAAEGIEPLVVASHLSPERLVQLQRALERCDPASNRDSMLLHELLIQRDYATHGRMSDMNANLVERWVARRIFLRQLELVDRVRRAQALSPSARLAELAEVGDLYSLYAEEEAPYTTAALESLVHAEFRSNNVIHELMFLESESRRRALIAAIACRRFEQERGALPADWIDLVDYGVAEAPLNPWTERPMTLRRADDGSVAIEAPWIEEALAAREARGSGDLEHEPFEAIMLPPRKR